MLEATVRDTPAATIVRLDGELDIASVTELDSELARVEGDGSPLVIDLRGVTFLDSSGLRSILAADARARGRGGRLLLVKASPTVHRVFEIALLDERLEFVDAPDIPD